jgi:uncharacterized protein
MPDDKSVPKPGHFLPGGAGDASASPEPRESGAGKTPIGLSKPEPLSQDGHPQQRIPAEFGDLGTVGEPARPGRLGELADRFGLSGILGSGGLGSGDRRFSKPVIAGAAALALLVLSGGVALAAQLISSYDDLVENPLSRPSVRTSPSVSPSDAQPTTTVTATSTPDAFVVKQNKLYTTGRLTSSKCREPSARPTSKTSVQQYFVETVRCLDKSWGPTIRKAGHEFRSPKLVMDKASQDCAGTSHSDAASYCSTDETLYVPWQSWIEKYPGNRIGIRVQMADTIPGVYAFHVQHLAGIHDASESRGSVAKNKAAELEETRRLQLQAACFGAMYLGANKQWHPWRGELLSRWRYFAAHSGDVRGKPRTYGSTRNVKLWNERGFQYADPKYCNTFAAPPSQVS